MKYHRHLDKYP